MPNQISKLNLYSNIAVKAKDYHCIIKSLGLQDLLKRCGYNKKSKCFWIDLECFNITLQLHVCFPTAQHALHELVDIKSAEWFYPSNDASAFSWDSKDVIRKLAAEERAIVTYQKSRKWQLPSFNGQESSLNFAIACEKSVRELQQWSKMLMDDDAVGFDGLPFLADPMRIAQKLLSLMHTLRYTIQNEWIQEEFVLGMQRNLEVKIKKIEINSASNAVGGDVPVRICNNCDTAIYNRGFTESKLLQGNEPFKVEPHDVCGYCFFKGSGKYESMELTECLSSNLLIATYSQGVDIYNTMLAPRVTNTNDINFTNFKVLKGNMIVDEYAVASPVLKSPNDITSAYVVVKERNARRVSEINALKPKNGDEKSKENCSPNVAQYELLQIQTTQGNLSANKDAKQLSAQKSVPDVNAKYASRLLLPNKFRNVDKYKNGKLQKGLAKFNEGVSEAKFESSRNAKRQKRDISDYEHSDEGDGSAASTSISQAMHLDDGKSVGGPDIVAPLDYQKHYFQQKALIDRLKAENDMLKAKSKTQSAEQLQFEINYQAAQKENKELKKKVAALEKNEAKRAIVLQNLRKIIDAMKDQEIYLEEMDKKE